MANALTAVRLLLVVPLGLLMAGEGDRVALLAALALTVAIVTDLADGPLARRLGTATPFSGIFDHTTDFLFVVGGMAGGVVRGVFPWLLPVVVTVAFVQYTLDSRWLHRHRGLRGSRLGRYNGVLYFAPLCGDTLVRLGLTFLGPAVLLVCWLLVASTVVSIVERVMLVRRASRTVPASPSAGRTDR